MSTPQSTTASGPPRQRTATSSAPGGTRTGVAAGRVPGGAHLGEAQSREAKRLAAVILEVLAGSRTPLQAAQALTLSVPRYYQLEARALRGLLQACESPSVGRQPSAVRELAALRQQVQRLQRELARQQGLLRLLQRSLGVAAPAPAPVKGRSGKRRPRRPSARALAVARQLRVGDNDASCATPAQAAAMPAP